MFEGTHTALITPFRDGKIDYESLAGLIDAQVSAGVDGVVPCGSTGEAATLSHAEHEELIAFTIKHVAGRVQVIAGTGSNSTAETVRLTRFAHEHGADGALLISPYYNKPTQDGLYEHFAAVAHSCELPILLYNIPGRSAVSIEPATMERLARLPTIVGVKEASGSLDQASRVIARCGPDFTVLSGDDSLTLPIMSVGGRGVIAVVTNLLPQRMKALVEAARAGDFATARTIHYELLPLMGALGLETNPIPIKTAMGMLGKADPTMRLPLTPMRDENQQQLRAVLEQVGLS